MKIDKVDIESQRCMSDFNKDDPERDDRCGIYLTLQINISDSEKKDIHDEVMSLFRREAESLILELREFVDKNKK